MLDEGHDPNGLTRKNEPLIEWILCDLMIHFDQERLCSIISLLAERGARLKTPLYMACFQGQTRAVEAMIRHVEDVDAKGEGQTCLHVCAKRR